MLLSDVDGLYDGDPRTPGAAPIVRVVRSDADLAGVAARRRRAGGRRHAAAWPPRSRRPGSPPPPGIPVVLAADRGPPTALAGADRRHLLPRRPGPRAPTRLLWLAHATDAARPAASSTRARSRAVVERRLSLLPAGHHRRSTATSSAGDPVDLLDENGHAVARGLVNFDATELPGAARPLDP